MKAKMIIDKDYRVGEVDPRLAASHVEHAGRGVYNGIYEPEHSLADEEGFRKDVIESVRQLGTTAIRYPGGNFVSNYDWMDGVGPKEQRPTRLELAWRQIEPNTFGTNEFLSWIHKVGNIDPMFTVNLGSGGMKEAVSLLEYCNYPGGTYYSDLRKKHGYDKPYNIKTWFLGNEMDGPWQLGGLSGTEYGRKAVNAGFAMRSMFPDLELILVGSSGNRCENYPAFMAEALEIAYDQVDMVSLHRYYGGHEGGWENGTEDFFAVSLDLEDYIRGSIATCDYIKAKKRAKKTINISLDEWNIWPKMPDEIVRMNELSPWYFGGPLAEGFMTYEDFLVCCFYNLTVLKHADRVKILCVDLLVNTSGPVHTEFGGNVWRQPNYYVIQHIARYGEGTVLGCVMEVPKYDSATYTDVPYVEAVPVYHEEKETLTLFCASRSLTEDTMLTLNLRGFEDYHVIEHIAVACEDLGAVNGPEGERIYPVNLENTTRVEEDQIMIRIPKMSWNVVRMGKKQA
ncbi:alpha-N-arabinofuranosidase [Parablautia intestinalis]|nr:alpha-L-arabinofuranosidase C-terminal domain-containing protein [Parablautia intestinalis]